MVLKKPKPLQTVETVVSIFKIIITHTQIFLSIQSNGSKETQTIIYTHPNFLINRIPNTTQIITYNNSYQNPIPLNKTNHHINPIPTRLIIILTQFILYNAFTSIPNTTQIIIYKNSYHKPIPINQTNQHINLPD